MDRLRRPYARLRGRFELMKQYIVLSEIVSDGFCFIIVHIHVTADCSTPTLTSSHFLSFNQSHRNDVRAFECVSDVQHAACNACGDCPVREKLCKWAGGKQFWRCSLVSRRRWLQYWPQTWKRRVLTRVRWTPMAVLHIERCCRGQRRSCVRFKPWVLSLIHMRSDS